MEIKVREKVRKEGKDKKKPDPRFQDCVITLWDFPINYPVMSDQFIEELFGEFCDYLICQIETCPETGREHAHIFCIFNTCRPRFSRIKAIFKEKKAHIEARVSTRQQARDYCTPEYVCKDSNKSYFGKTKAEYTWKAGPFEFGTFRDRGQRSDQKVIRQFIWDCQSIAEFWQSEYGISKWCITHRNWCESQFVLKPQPNLSAGVKMNDFQYAIGMIIDFISHQNKTRPCCMGRLLLVVQDTVGGHGKSVMCSLLLDRFNAYHVAGSTRDVISGYNNEPVVFWDIVRKESNENLDYFPTKQVELFSNGHLANTKYIVFNKRFPAPAPVIFTNSEAIPYSDLTNDRWRIMRIEKDHSVNVYTIKGPLDTWKGFTPVMHKDKYFEEVFKMSILTAKEGLAIYNKKLELKTMFDLFGQKSEIGQK